MSGTPFVQGFGADIVRHGHLAAEYAATQENLRSQSHGAIDVLGASFRDAPYLRTVESHDGWSQLARRDTDHGQLQSEVNTTVGNRYLSSFEEAAATMTVSPTITA